MTALSAPAWMPDAKPAPWTKIKSQRLVGSGELLYHGGVTMLDPATGKWVEATADATLIAHGFLDHIADDGKVDNSADAFTEEAFVQADCRLLVGSGLTDADEWTTAFVVDSATFSKSSSGGARPVMGLIVEVVDSTHAYVWVHPVLSAYLSTAILASAAVGLIKRTVTIGHADLTDAVNGEAQAINIGAALPTNAIVLGHEVNIATLFSGGSVSAVKLDIGGADADAIVSQLDVFTGAATGALSPRTGAHAQGKFSAEQLTATFTPDGGHTLLALSAGSLTITVWASTLA